MKTSKDNRKPSRKTNITHEHHESLTSDTPIKKVTSRKDKRREMGQGATTIKKAPKQYVVGDSDVDLAEQLHGHAAKCTSSEQSFTAYYEIEARQDWIMTVPCTCGAGEHGVAAERRGCWSRPYCVSGPVSDGDVVWHSCAPLEQDPRSIPMTGGDKVYCAACLEHTNWSHEQEDGEARIYRQDLGILCGCDAWELTFETLPDDHELVSGVEALVERVMDTDMEEWVSEQEVELTVGAEMDR